LQQYTNVQSTVGPLQIFLLDQRLASVLSGTRPTSKTVPWVPPPPTRRKPECSTNAGTLLQCREGVLHVALSIGAQMAFGPLGD
jgi:hypothetical protein